MVWTGFKSQGGERFVRLGFVNGLLKSYIDKDISGETNESSVFKFSVSTDKDAKFRIGEKGDVWTSSYAYLDPKNPYVDADGNFAFSCTLKSPKTLYTKDSDSSKIVKQGTSTTVYLLGSQASEGTFHSTAKITYYKPGETVPEGGFSVKGYKEDNYHLYYSGGSKTYYNKGTEATFGNYTKFCDKDAEITGQIKVALD